MYKKHKKKIKNFQNLRIIGGKWRRRKLPTMYHSCLRPTTNKAKEMLFNWLIPVISGSHCLDGFAGSGSLGIEALSRQASKVTFIEKNYKSSVNLNKIIDIFDPNNNDIKVINVDLHKWLKKSNEIYNIVFLDPPFRKDLIHTTIELLVQYNHLIHNSWVYIETEKTNKLYFSEKYWKLYRNKTIGNSMHQLFTFNSLET
ncbi:16S rRNA (guanine(966)-N(2))-methyltransferase RsmD [Blochmannia endosymbiont of Camponotus (Colobopsis) obliquus]|uniref:16S rRNA (guanine(966)-N(2))-methyltransferase RsmD n=1 Tax=Blochmannia endosymbiont of Camponotus (Colobopsis) obliquus TaxID=1505597 RepID=UPI00061A7E7B|nr:16S rRNA (guanine(966)-N(2))-methyltransferase RsmD [Blochmannia endosymbiont of Camponotus (Colobopsis) obliquus]AKC60768.1 Ribosomal RNA small subunit methyltransferase D [Blochmannia endosymbiont of Camponotus (Colobopsis) obliquus]